MIDSVRVAFNGSVKENDRDNSIPEYFIKKGSVFSSIPKRRKTLPSGFSVSAGSVSKENPTVVCETVPFKTKIEVSGSFQEKGGYLAATKAVEVISEREEGTDTVYIDTKLVEGKLLPDQQVKYAGDEEKPVDRDLNDFVDSKVSSYTVRWMANKSLLAED